VKNVDQEQIAQEQVQEQQCPVQQLEVSALRVRREKEKHNGNSKIKRKKKTVLEVDGPLPYSKIKSPSRYDSRHPISAFLAGARLQRLATPRHFLMFFLMFFSCDHAMLLMIIDVNNVVTLLIII